MSGVAPAGAVSRPSKAVIVSGLCIVVQQEGAAAEAGTLRFDEAERRLDRDRRVGRAAAGAQHLESGLDGDRVGGGDAGRQDRCGGRCAQRAVGGWSSRLAPVGRDRCVAATGRRQHRQGQQDEQRRARA